MTTFGSVASGIEAASVAFAPLGWHAAWFSEIEPFPSALLAQRYPHVPNLGDMRQLPLWIRAGLIEAPDVFCGGTPCQAFSVAGLRKSLADDRGNLSMTFCEIADAIDDRRATPCAILWENVPGVLSTSDNAFGCFLAGLAGEDDPLEPPTDRPAAGKSSDYWRWDRDTGEHVAKWANAGVVYGPRRTVAWRTLDAQYFGLAQRRKRVFVVASAREGFDPVSVLFEFDGVRRDTAPSRRPTQDAARTLAGGARVSGGYSYDDIPIVGALMAAQGPAGHGHSGFASNTAVDCGHVIADTLREHTRPGSNSVGTIVAFGGNNTSGPIDVAAGLNAKGGAGRMDFESETFVTAMGFNARQDPDSWNELSGPMDTDAYTQAVAFQSSQSGVRVDDVHATLDSNNGSRRHNGALDGMQVRRLTPRECERLQGFPDDYTNVPINGKPAADGPRYKALGNSWPVPVINWIAARMAAQL